MFRQYWCSRSWAIHAWGLGFSVVALTVAMSMLQYHLNQWRGDFYGELEAALKSNRGKQTPTDEYYRLTRRWIWLSAPMAPLYAISYLVTSFWAFGWRQALTDDYQQRYERRTSKVQLEGVSQRIQEDTRGLAEQINRLFSGFFGSIVTFCV